MLDYEILAQLGILEKKISLVCTYSNSLNIV